MVDWKGILWSNLIAEFRRFLNDGGNGYELENGYIQVSRIPALSNIDSNNLEFGRTCCFRP